MYKDNAKLFYPTPALEPIPWDKIKAGEPPMALPPATTEVTTTTQ